MMTACVRGELGAMSQSFASTAMQPVGIIRPQPDTTSVPGRTAMDQNSAVNRVVLLRVAAMLAAIGLAAWPSLHVQAQATYPTKPVKLVVGFAPGGPTDILARVISAGM